MRARAPAVAGRFYEGSPERLQSQLNELLPECREKIPAIGILSPHAGYVFSGAVAGAVFGQVELPRLFIVLCPNHTGLGAPLALMDSGTWKTPLGEVPVNTALASHLAELCPALEVDESAHRLEHSLEVQLPFIQFLRPEAEMVPVCLGTQRLDLLLELAGALAEAIRQTGEPVLLVASSDMTHYEPAATAREKDRLAISAMEKLDAHRLHAAVRQHHITMCGMAAAVAVVEASRQSGAERGRLISYQTSGDTTGDMASVVGYAGMIFS